MDREDKLNRELRHHLAQLTAEYICAGMSESEARRRARLEFGELEVIKEDCRDVRPRRWLDEILKDIQFAVRGFWCNSRFAVSAVAVIALAIGGASAVFSVVDRNLLRPLPYRSGDRLVSIGIVAPVITAGDWLFAGTYREWRSALHLESITAWKGTTDCDRSDGAPERLSCVQAEANFLPNLGVHPIVGRNFTVEEDRPGAGPIALISYDLWRARFGGDPAILEKRITLDGVATRIAGVLPPDFELPSLARADVLLPLKLTSTGQNQRLLSVVGRLPQGQSAASLEAQVQPLFKALMQTLPPNLVQAIQPRLRVATLRDQQTREYQSALWMLLGAVLSFVLLACANVASLLLARSAARRREFAVRAALGASRLRLVQQTLTESAVLAAAAIPLGWALAYILLAIFRRLAPSGTMRIHQAALDWRVFVFALGISAVAAVLFGLAPALERLRGEDLTGSRISGSRRQWLRSGLVCTQLSVSVILLTTSGLFLTSLWRLQQAPLGFSPETVVTASFVLPAERYGIEERQIAFFTELERRLAESPGVTAAAITDSLPPGGDPRSFPLINFWRGAAKTNAHDNGGPVKWRFVTTGYLRALGIPIVRGRAFSDDDSRGVPKVILNETLARKVFEEQSPVDREISLWGNSCQIVGVAVNTRNSGLTAAPDPELYVLRPQTPNAISANQRPPFGWRQAIAVMRSNLGHAAATETLRLALEQTDPSIAIVMGSLNLEVNGFFARPRFQTAVLLFFAFLGLFLAAFGLYGLTSFLAAERTREVGIRIALGATPRRIVAMMMKDGLRWSIFGLALGLAATAVIGRWLQSNLYETKPLDSGVLLASIAVLGITVVWGTLVPSLRASRTDPALALRRE